MNKFMALTHTVIFCRFKKKYFKKHCCNPFFRVNYFENPCCFKAIASSNPPLFTKKAITDLFAF